MKRFLALLAAAALVVGAIAVRGLIDDGDSAARTDSLTLICGPDLEEPCKKLATEGESVEVVIEDESTTAGSIASGELRLGESTAWLAAAPWPPIAAASSTGGEGFPDLVGSAALAASPAVIVARTDRMEAITATCGTVTWACIGERAGGPWTDLGGQTGWGRVEVGLPAPQTGGGVVALDQAIASRVGRTDFAINDLDDDPATAAWFDRLVSESKSNERKGLTPLQQFIRLPGSLGVVGALEAEARQEISRASAGSAMAAVVPEPVSLAQVRLWSADGESLSAASDRVDLEVLSTLLEDSGWTGPGNASDPGAGTMVAEDQGPYPDAGLPKAGVMSAVITRWEGVR